MTRILKIWQWEHADEVLKIVQIVQTIIRSLKAWNYALRSQYNQQRCFFTYSN